MTELSDYMRIVSEPHKRAQEERIGKLSAHLQSAEARLSALRELADTLEAEASNQTVTAGTYTTDELRGIYSERHRTLADAASRIRAVLEGPELQP
jgi:hypothetical protein